VDRPGTGNIVVPIIEPFVVAGASATEGRFLAGNRLRVRPREPDDFLVGIEFVRRGVPAEPLELGLVFGQPLVVLGDVSHGRFHVGPDLLARFTGRPADPPPSTASDGTVEGQSPPSMLPTFRLVS